MAKLEDILQRLHLAEQQINTIQRGVYGDSKNEVKGLIQIVRDIEKTVKQIQDYRKKVIYFSGGALAVIEIIVQIVKWKYN